MSFDESRSGSRPAAIRPRGRPQRLPVDPSPYPGPQIDLATRCAWLLATSRLLAPATRGMSRNDVIASLRGRGVMVDASRISRWESGHVVPATDVLEAYEELTLVPQGSLTSIVRRLRRRAGVPATRAAGSRRVDFSHDELDELLAGVLDGVASGSDWVRLSSTLTVASVYLHPSMWASVCDHLISELTRASGIAYVLRYEAATELFAHSVAARHLGLSIGRFVMHPDAQRVTPALALLREVEGEHVSSLVVRLMGSENPVLRQGAAYLVAGMGEPGETSLRTPGRPGLAPARPPALRAAESVTADAARSRADAVATEVEHRLGRAAHDPDQMLRRLVREALFAVDHARRNLAAGMLAVTPYAEPLGDAVLRTVVRGDAAMAGAGWSFLHRLGDVLPRTVVAPLALRETRPALRTSAVLAAGLAHGELDDASAAAARERLLDVEHEADRPALLTLLGLSGHAELDAVARHGDAVVANGARWWQGVGIGVHDLPPTLLELA